MSIEPGNIIMSFDFDMLTEAYTNCFGVVYWSSFDDIRAAICTVYAFQVIQGKRYECNFLVSTEMVNDTKFLHAEVRRYMQDAFKNKSFTLESVV